MKKRKTNLLLSIKHKQTETFNKLCHRFLYTQTDLFRKCLPWRRRRRREKVRTNTGSSEVNPWKIQRRKRKSIHHTDRGEEFPKKEFSCHRSFLFDPLDVKSSFSPLLDCNPLSILFSCQTKREKGSLFVDALLSAKITWTCLNCIHTLDIEAPSLSPSSSWSPLSHLFFHNLNSFSEFSVVLLRTHFLVIVLLSPFSLSSLHLLHRLYATLFILTLHPHPERERNEKGQKSVFLITPLYD